jgi:GntR family transcriptional regulator
MTNDSLQPLRTNRISLSEQAQEYLHSLIDGGTYEPGERLPSEKELAARLGISRPTLREALQHLEQDGVVVRKHGVGTFVAPGYDHRLESGLERLESILELAARQGLDLRFSDLRIGEEPANAELADKLGVKPGCPLTRVERVIRADGRPVAYMEDIVPAAVLSGADIDKGFRGSVLDLLRQAEDLRVAQAVADIVALNADAALASRLSVEEGQALLLLEEVLFDEEGKVVEFSRNYHIPDFFRFHIVRR